MIRVILASLALSTLTGMPCFAEDIIVQPGETLSEIAERHNISTYELMSINEVRNPNSIRAGQKLSLNEVNSYANPSQEKLHIVKSGDTIGLIAMQYGLLQKDLMLLNDLDSPNYIYIGQKLKLTSNKMNTSEFHIVNSGETIENIAMKYGKSKDEIIRMNNIENSNHIYPGQRISLVSKSKKSSHQVVKGSINGQEDVFHTVSQGETLMAISKKYKVPMKRLIAFNSIENENNLLIDSKLLIHKKPNEDLRQETGSNPQSNLQPTKKVKLWKTYGPLKIDWSSWKSVNGSYVTPTVHSNGSKLYLAINCSFKKINATGNDGAWRSWISPLDTFEYRLINDVCKQKAINS